MKFLSSTITNVIIDDYKTTFNVSITEPFNKAIVDHISFNFPEQTIVNIKICDAVVAIAPVKMFKISGWHIKYYKYETMTITVKVNKSKINIDCPFIMDIGVYEHQ